MKTNVVKVKLWGTNVGYLSWDSREEVAVFEYDPSFLKLGWDIAPLTMPVNASRSRKQMPWLGNKDAVYRGLPPMIADSLPDKWGNSLFNSWLRDNKISTKNITPIDHLSFIGSRAMGALEYEPAEKLGDDSPFSVDVQRLYHFAKQVLNERESTVLTRENSILWQDLVKVSSSPGGKRPKAIVALNDDTGEVISGQGTIPEGFLHYILKYDDSSIFPYAKLEYIYYKMAVDTGIAMTPSDLRTYEGATHFLTRRFDRIGNDKIHTQTLAAMSPLSTSYEDIFATIRRLNLPYEDSRQQYLRMVFNVLARNVDDHSKNVSFCMNRDGVWRLSPAYDVTFSVDLAAPAYVNKQSLTINGKNKNITREDLEAVARNNDILEYNTLIDGVKASLSTFEEYADRLNISKSLVNRIVNDFVRV